MKSRATAGSSTEQNTSDGEDLVSTWWDSDKGNKVGDDRKSSKFLNANDESYALAA